ncbi:MAG: tripartite tricarboxylate transporter substrate binding protein [Thermodesulfobacteriota bacterium]
MTPRKGLLLCLALVCLGCVLVSTVAAADNPAWPIKPVRLIVPFSPGGGTDFIARILAQKLSETFGNNFIVDNRPGGGGSIGSEMTVRAAPDGYTMCMVSASYAATAALRKLPYDAVEDIAPISLLAYGPLIAAAGPGLKANNLKEFLALARAKPDTITYGSTGVGSLAHLVGELVDQRTGVRTVHVPYKGAGPGITDLLGGYLQLGYYTAVAVQAHIQSGKLRALGVTTRERSDAFPGVPTIGEIVPGFEAEHWYGFWGTRGTPPQIIARVNQAVGKALQSPDLRARISADGFVASHSTPEEFRQRVRRDVSQWREVARRAKIDVE